MSGRSEDGLGSIDDLCSGSLDHYYLSYADRADLLRWMDWRSEKASGIPTRRELGY